VEYPETSRARVTLPPSQAKSGNRDFVLTYQLAGQKIESGLLLYEGKEENFFLLMGQPPKQVEPEQIPHREYIFVMDVSGSMRGFPLNTSKKLIRNLLVNLRPQDRFNILFFAGGSGVLSEHPLQATPENIEKAIHYVENQRGGGGTEILPALNRALNMPPVKNSSRIVVISTDGMVGVERETFELIRNNLGQANFFPFGIGSSVNRFIIEGMARAGMGEPQVVKSKSEAARKAERFRDYINSPVLTDVKINFGSFNAYAVEPPSLPDLFAEKPIIAFGKWKGPLEGTITLSGRTPQGSYQRRLDVTKFRPDYAHKALKYLWARHRIKLLSDYHEVSGDDQLKKKVTELGLKYNLLTPFTSFVAIDQRIRRDGDTVQTVKQPLPMPEGMPNTAIGRRATAFSASLGQKTVMARKPSSDQSQGTVAQPSLSSPNITVLTGALTARELRPLFSEKAQTLQSCFASASGPLTLETVVQLTASGDLKLVSISSSNGSQSLVDCVKQFLRDRSIPEELQNKTGRFRATFSRK
jgi:Ca-activated chloride channel family protein